MAACLEGCDLASSGASGEFVGEVPGAKITRFQADQEVAAGTLGVCGSGLAGQGNET